MATKKKKAAPKKAATTFPCSKCGRKLKSKGGHTVHERSCAGKEVKPTAKKAPAKKAPAKKKSAKKPTAKKKAPAKKVTAKKKAPAKKAAPKKTAAKKTASKKKTTTAAAATSVSAEKKTAVQSERRSLPVEARRHHSHLISPVQPQKKKRSGFSIVTVGEIYLTTVLFCLIIFGASYWTVALSELFGWADTITTSTDLLAQKISLLQR